jgi:hypothetical protein
MLDGVSERLVHRQTDVAEQFVTAQQGAASPQAELMS